VSKSITNIPAEFADAVAKFKAFLVNNGQTGPILWISPNDVTSRGAETWVRWPVADDNLIKVQQLYDSFKAGAGLRFVGQCRAGEFICCTIAGPTPGDDETGRFISGLTLSVATPLREAKTVSSRLQWSRLLDQNGILPTSGIAAFIYAEA
jgi:hypothetical protein